MKIILASFLSPDYERMPYGIAALKCYLDLHLASMSPSIIVETVSLPATMDVPSAAARLAERAPNVVGLSCYVWNYAKSLSLVAQLKQIFPSALLIIGGPQVSPELPAFNELLEQRILSHCFTSDGESELLHWVRSQLISPARIALTIGARERVGWSSGTSENLDALVSPYRTNPELLSEVARTGVAYIEGARGCPFRCSFCDEGWKKPHTRSLEKVMKDVAFLYEHGARDLIFLDPTFNFDRARMRELVSFMKEELPGLRFYAEIKVDVLNEADVECLASIPGTSIEVGLQSSNPATLKRIQRPTNLEKLAINTRALATRGVSIGINTIFGLPGEALSDWLKTVQFCYLLGPVFITSTCLKVLPNTEVFRQRTQYGYIYDQHDLFRARASKDMPEEQFELAQRLSSILDRLQPNAQALPDGARVQIARRYAGSLPRFLLDAAGVSMAPSEAASVRLPMTSW